MLKNFQKILILIFVISALISCSLFKKYGNSVDEDPRIKTFNFNSYFLEANKQKILGNYEESLKNYSMAMKVDETQAIVYYEIAGLLNMMQDYNSAMTYAEKAVEFDNTENDYYKLLLAYLYQNNSLYEKSAEVYESLIKSKPEVLNYYFELSNLYMTLNKPSEAIKTLNSAEKKFGITDMISLEKEKYYNIIGEKDKALIEVQKLSEAFPTNSKFKAILAESYVNIKMIDKAKALYIEIEKMEIEDGIIYLSMADFYRVNHEYDKTFTMLLKGFSRDDVDLDIKIQMMIKMLELMGEDEYLKTNTKELMQQLLLTYPTDTKVRTLNSDYLVFTGDYTAAQKEFDYILQFEKDKYVIWEQALYVDWQLQDMKSLYKRSKEAVELFPTQGNLYRFYITSAYFTENFSEVVEAVDYASDLAKNNDQLLIEFLSLQGDAYHKLNKHNESDSVYDIVLFKNKDYVNVLNNYSYFLALRGEKLDKAFEMSSRLISIVKDNATYIDTHAWVLYKRGEYQQALNFINQALELDPKNNVYFEHKGDILYQMSNFDEALKMWLKAKEFGKGSEFLDEKIKTKKLIE